MSERINVTKTFTPNLEEYQKYLKKIWETGYLTNQGPLLLEFQEKVEEYLGVRNFHFVTNGTLALQVAIKALGIKGGEVITTPFSYVATTSAILSEHCTPVYVDIESDTYNINASKIEAAITKETKAILAVHVFGNPCDIEAIEEIAKKHKLKVIYDAAHAFGVDYRGRSIFSYGDISIASFHATKLFHTIEGGGVFVNNDSVSDKVELIKRFGHNGDEHFILGINAKASEFQAAMGLCNLNYVTQNIGARKELSQLYSRQLKGVLKLQKIAKDTKYNYAYYPVVFKNEYDLRDTLKVLNDRNIFPRRYFYPSLNQLPYIENAERCLVSEDIARRIACLPLYADLADQDVLTVCKLITSNLAERG